MRTLSLAVIAVSIKHKTCHAFASGTSRPQPSSFVVGRKQYAQRKSKNVGGVHLLSRASGTCDDSTVAVVSKTQVLHSMTRLRGGTGDNCDNHESTPSSSFLWSLRGWWPWPSSSSFTRSTSYYLIWSPGFFQKFAIASVTLWGIYVFRADVRVVQMLSRQWQWIGSVFFDSSTRSIRRPPSMAAMSNVILPLLSSSCCLIQLVINVLVGAGGCAGFNTMLGPIRPLFLAMLISLNSFSGASLRQSIWRYGIALMPEGVHVWNECRKNRWNHVLTVTNDNDDNNNKSKIRATILVDIPTMGCVACINKIESNLRTWAPRNKVLSTSSWLETDRKGGCAKLEVCVDSEADLQSLSQTVVTVIEGAGFQGSIVTKTEVLPQQQ